MGSPGGAMKSALVHYWLVTQRGGESVLEAIGELLPDADLFAHVIDETQLFGSLKGRATQETFIGRLPFARRHYQAYLPLMPLALERLDLNDYDLIVSSEAGPAKWVIPGPNTQHICYCHSPLRYIWDQRQIYLDPLPAPIRSAANIYASHLRQLDVASSKRVDTFVANSEFVARRIWKYYRREAEVIHPPVDLKRFAPAASHDDFYLVAGELRGYKRVDLAVRACTELGRRLIVVGAGSGRARLEKLAGPTVEFRGRVEHAELKRLFASCRALLFPGVEDFGIVPLEVMASGRPVIALGRGGAVETVVHERTGILFPDATVESLKKALLTFEAEEHHFRPDACVAQAARFGRDLFQAKFATLLGEPLAQPVKAAAVVRPAAPAFEPGMARRLSAIAPARRQLDGLAAIRR